jgi:hypothetical protein
MEDANLCVENSMNENDPIYLLQCMEAQTSDESRLMKEMELLTACIYGEDNAEFLLSALMGEINLTVPDPKSQREIDRMNSTDAKRFKDATLNEVKGMKGKDVFENITWDELPLERKFIKA